MSDKTLPTAIEAERAILGSILLDDTLYLEAASQLDGPNDFSIEKHRRIWKRMSDIAERSEKIDRITLSNELMRHGELEAVDGLAYLISLDDGLPQLSSIAHWIRPVREAAALRATIFSCQRTIDRCMTQEGDSGEILAELQSTSLRISQTGLKGSSLVGAAEILQHYEGGISAFLDPTKRQKGIQTGFIKFDEMTSGLHPGDLFILAGRPSHGKTALGLNIAYHAAVKSQAKTPVAIFSLEMPREALLTRLVCAAARVDSQRFRMNYLTQEEKRKLNVGLHEIAESPIYIDDTANMDLVDVHAKLRRMKQEHGLGLAVLDYLQLLASGRGKYGTRNEEVSAQSRGLKIMAKELGIPMMVLSQLSRAPEGRTDHRPQLGDLRDSGGIEQDGDIVAFIFREEVYERDREDLRGLAELIVAKQRNGPIGTVNLVWLHGQTKFENRCEDTGELPEDGQQEYWYDK